MLFQLLLVDRILEMDKENQTIKGKKNVTMNEEFFNGHFPGHPIMPGVLIVEGMAQCLGVMVMENYPGKVPYFAAIESAKFKNPVKPGDTLIYDVKVDKVDKENDENNGIYQIAREIQKFNKEYSVKKSIEHDEDTKEDGGIEFDLSTVFDDIFLNKKEEL